MQGMKYAFVKIVSQSALSSTNSYLRKRLHSDVLRWEK